MSFEILKCAVLGDGTVGKTSLLSKYCNGEAFLDYIPTIVDFYERLVNKKGSIFKLQFMDLAGQDDYSNMRKYYYDSYINIIILVFDLTNKMSLENILTYWVPEIQKNFNQNIPVILVGTKLDLILKNPQKNTDITNKDIINVINKLNCNYVECSSLTGLGIPNLISYILDSYEKSINIKKKRRSLKRGLTI